MEGQQQLLPMARHGHHRTREAEDLFLKAPNGEQAEEEGAGGAGGPALSQTNRFNVFLGQHVNGPFFIGMPGIKMDAVKFAKKMKRRREGNGL